MSLAGLVPQEIPVQEIVKPTYAVIPRHSSVVVCTDNNALQQDMRWGDDDNGVE